MPAPLAKLAAIGSYAPPKILTNADLEQMVATSDEWIRTRTGISQRRIAEDGVATSDLGLEAARLALERARVEPGELDLVIVATVTPDMLFPATACLVQDRLGATRAAAFDISAGCTGFVYGLAAASHFITSGSCQRALVVGAETLSRFTDWTDRRTCVLLGDGAGAAVLIPADDNRGMLSFYLRADGSGAAALHVPAGGSRMPATAQTVEQGLHYTVMDGPEVFRFAVVAMEQAGRTAAERAGVELEQISLVVPHQANIRIIEAAAKRLELPLDRFYCNVDRYGNTGAASIPLALDQAQQEGRLHPGDLVLLVGFGAGLTWGGAVIRW